MLNMELSQFVEIIDALYDEVIIYDNNYKIIYINRACERHYGKTKNEMIGTSFYDYADEYWNLSVLPYVYKTKKAVRQNQETKLGAKILTIAIPILDNYDEVKYVAMSVRDVLPEDLRQDLFLMDKALETQSVKFQGDIITRNKEMLNIMDMTSKIADVDVPCLITGESGVGKTLIGKHMHKHSKRAKKPFVHVNSAAISKELIESELFGYTKGSFTGANKDGKKGLVKEADGGILFLDEIAEIPYKLQAKLLHFIQEKEFYPVGSTKPVKVDVKIIAATNKNLRKMVESGSFREDLYYRLNVFEIYIPPLRERREDIILLCDYYLNMYNDKYCRTHRFSKEVRDILKNYSWNGNIRELSNIMERLVVIAKEVELRPWHLPKHLFGIREEVTEQQPTEFNISKEDSLDSLINNYEEKVIKHCFKVYHTTRKVSDILGISQSKASRLYRKYVKDE